MTGDSRKTILENFLVIHKELSRHLTRRLGKGLDADDVLQDTFLRLHSIPADSDIRNPRSYLFRVADNLATDRIRSRQTHGRHFASVDNPASVDESPSPESVVDYRQRLARLQQAVAELPDRQRQVFLMHKYDGLSHSEIAGELGITKSAVEKLVMKALAHCRDRLGDLID